MVCKKCGGGLWIIDNVHNLNNESYRRRKCKECGHIMYTIETEVEWDDIKYRWSLYHRRNVYKRKQ